MNRRSFLKLGASGLVLGSFGYLMFRLSDASLTSYIQNVLDKHLEPGELKAGGIADFVADFKKHAAYLTRKDKGMAYLLSATSSVAGDTHFSDALDEFRENFDRHVISDYLLSSDFFFEPKQPGETIGYLGFANRICAQANPFARFLES